MSDRSATPPRHVFVVGLHRSGTTMLTDILGEHPDISAFKDLGVPMNEGQYVQSVISPVDRLGRFSFHPSAHRTETDDLATPAHRETITREWNAHWDLDKPVLLEKSPANVFRMRLLQYYFPDSAFVLIHRHPIAATLATKKWMRKLPRSAAVWNWVRTHRIALDDAQHLGRFHRIAYEELIAQPERELARLSAFLGLEIAMPSFEIRQGINDKYLADWENHGRSGPIGALEKRLTEALFRGPAARLGYAL